MAIKSSYSSLLPPHLSRKCKEDFAHSLDGINTVTRDFLSRINNMFPHQLTFHLTCDSQRDYMEKLKNSCTNLSRDVENKFQHYLNRVGDKVGAVTHRRGQTETDRQTKTVSWTNR